jgi:hypothetical protein
VRLFDNNAKSCFDWMIPNVVNMMAIQMGMIKEICRTHANLLEKVKYKIITMLGFLDNHYTNSKENPIIGPGQDGAASAHIWGIISLLMLEVMKRERNTAPTSMVSIKWVMDAFVDDTTWWVNRFLQQLLSTNKKQALQNTVQELQDSAQLWEKLLSASGGVLELSTCFYYIVHWIWENSRARMAMKEELGQHKNLQLHHQQKSSNSTEGVFWIPLNPWYHDQSKWNEEDVKRLKTNVHAIAQCMKAKWIRRSKG